MRRPRHSHSQFFRPEIHRVALAVFVWTVGMLVVSALAWGQSPADSDGGAVSPPVVVESVEAIYPPGALASGVGARVELIVTVLVDGTVGDVEVAGTAGDAFDSAAVDAIRQWRFEPASRSGEAIDSRIRVPFVFSLPAAAVVPPTASAQVEVDGPSPDGRNPDDRNPSEPDPDEPIDVTVRGERELRTEERSAGDFRIERDVIAASPRQEGAEVIRSAPGLYIGRGEGPAVAHNYMLRGFDAEHGQDIEFRVGGLPINLPSHIHGQGYADLGFLIGDVVSELRVAEGVYDPRQGDFAVAGSIELDLGVAEADRGVRLRSSIGAFNTSEHLVVWAPKEAAQESFGAVQFTNTDGFGENRAGRGGSGLFQHRFELGEVSVRMIGILRAARSDMAGVVRANDVESGQVCFDCVYDLPTARAQNALANRLLAGVFVDHESESGANGQLGFWLGHDNFRIQQNFTGFINESRVLERVAGRGDLIEQQNQTLSLGLTGRYRTAPYRPTRWAHGTVEVGADGRMDSIDQAQNLLDAAVRNQTWDRRVDASIRSSDLGLWADTDWTLTRYVRLRAGVRADMLSFDVEDRLGNFVPSIRPQDSFIQGFRRSALGVAAGPRASVEIHATQWMSLLAAYGEGYRSPQARLLEDGESAPFSKVKSTDIGVRFDWGRPLELTVGGYLTRLSDDVAFDAGEGRLERIGATRRLGMVAHAVTRPLDWLVGSASVTLVQATLQEPPPATADEPQPPFEEGQSLPFVPPVVIRADVGATHALIKDLGGRPLDGRAGLGFSYLSPRPLPFGEFADPVSLLDASAAALWGPLELEFKMFNALNARYAAVEYSFPSDWNPDDGVRPRTPARHTSAGAPLSWMVSLGVLL
jgi:TonB family protein